MTFKQFLLYPFAKRFFAGLTLEDALARAGHDNARGVSATLDYLGEDVRDGTEAEKARLEYSRIIEEVAKRGLDASVAIKLTHIGLDISREMAENSALELAALARAKGVFVWVDMEGSAHTQATIGIYRRLLMEYPGGVGVALQAYLKRTWDDLESLVGEGAKVRLVKGAYNEPPEIAVNDSRELRGRFIEMAEYLGRSGRPFAIGTHDRAIISAAEKMAEGRDGIEYQMLMGIRDDVKLRLAGAGRRVVEYIPYGNDWYGYGIRRLKEKRRNLAYFALGLFGR